jgi:hypothetical protein
MLRVSNGKVRARSGPAAFAAIIGGLVAVAAKGGASGLHADATGLAVVCAAAGALALALVIRHLRAEPPRQPPGGKSRS